MKKKCNKKTCKFYESGRANCCDILASVYENDKDCRFFKKAPWVDKRRNESEK